MKNTDTAEEKGYDAGKKVSGIKRHIAVDTQGLPHAIAVTTANVTDRTGALLAFSLNKKALSEVKMCWPIVSIVAKTLRPVCEKCWAQR